MKFRWALTIVLSASVYAEEEVEETDTPVLETVVKEKPSVDVRRVAGSAHVFTQADMERHEYDDVNNLLRGTPGVYLRTEDGYGLRPNIGMRGVNSDRSSKITLMEDDVLFGPAPYSAPAAYYFPLITRMTGAELFKGPGTVRYGPQTIGGAFNLRSRSVPTLATGELDLALGPYGADKMHGWAGYGNEGGGLLVEGVRLGSDGFKVLDNNGPTGFLKNEFMAKAVWKKNFGAVRNHLELKWVYSDEISHETYLGLTEADFEKTPLRRYAASQNDVMTWDRNALLLSHRLVTDTFSLETKAYTQAVQRTWQRLNRFARGPDLRTLLGGPGRGQDAVWLGILRGELDTETPDQNLLIASNNRTFLSQGIQTKATWQVKKNSFENRLELGARFHFDSITRLHTDDAHQMVNGTLVPTGQDADVTTHNHAFTRALSFYLQDELSWDGWLLVPGARMEVISNSFRDVLAETRQKGSSVEVLPGLGVVRQLGERVDVLAGVYQGFSPVTPGQAQAVRPEKSWNYEAGVRYRSQRVKAELIGFLNDYFNIVGECTLSSGCDEDALNRQFNGGAARVYGLEASASLNFPTWKKISFQLQTNYTLSLSEFLSSFVSEAPQFGNVNKFDELPYIPRHLANVSLRASRGKWSASMVLNYVGASREQAGSGPIPTALLSQEHLLLDAAVHYQVGPSSEFYVTGNNLLNATYVAAHRPFGARPGAPINGMVGFKHRF